MELDWTTFALEIINFLVLVWVLTHFLYRPVLDIIERRRAETQGRLDEAERRRADAERLQQQYDGRLADWEREREDTRRQLREQLDAEGRRLREDQQQALEQEREKARVLLEHEHEELMREWEREALRQGGEFTARLLARLAGPELERSILRLVIEDLERLGPEAAGALSAAVADGSGIQISSAYPLDVDQQAALQEHLRRLCGSPVTCTFDRDVDLICGVSMHAGNWQLDASLREELRYFMEAGDDGG